MPDDPSKCRTYATRCVELAANDNNLEIKAIYLALAKDWEIFAVSLEKALAQQIQDAANT